MVRVGIVGTGFGARVVAPVFASTEGCTVVDVVSARDDAAVRALSRRPDVDLVGVHSPPFLHRTHVGYALEAGHAVLCDKPFGRDAADAGVMFAEAHAAAVVHLVDFEFRYAPSRGRLRELVGGGALGKVEHVVWTHLGAGSRTPLRPYGWLFDRASGGGWVGAWGSHAVDTLRWILEEELTVVASTPRIDVPERLDHDGRRHRVDAEDGFSALLRTTSGVSVTIDSTFAATAATAPRLVVTTARAVVEVVADSRITVRHADGTREQHDATPDDGAGDPHVAPMRRFAVAARDAVREGAAGPGTPTFADGLACARVLDRLRG